MSRRQDATRWLLHENWTKLRVIPFSRPSLRTVDDWDGALKERCSGLNDLFQPWWCIPDGRPILLRTSKPKEVDRVRCRSKRRMRRVAIQNLSKPRRRESPRVCGGTHVSASPSRSQSHYKRAGLGA